MNSMDKKVKQYLSSLDVEPFCPIKEFEIEQELMKIFKEFDQKATGESLYEFLAFELFPRGEGGVSEWGTFFGSKASFNNEDGSTVEFPDRKLIDKNAVEYWAKRAIEAKHPILVARYADLVCDFSKLIDLPFNYKLAQLVIDNIIKICEQNLVLDTYQRLKLHRAMSMARKISDSKRLRIIATTTIETEKKIATDDKPGLWGFSLKWFVLENEGEKILKDQEVKDLIEETEERLKRLLSAEDPNPWNIECAINLLVPYYIKINDTLKASRSLLALEDGYRRNKRSNSDAMLKVYYLEKLDALYRQNKELPDMGSHIEKIAKELPEASKASLNEMKTIGTEYKITRQQIEESIKSIFEQDGSLLPIEKVITRLIGNFLIHKEKAKEELDKMSKQFIFQFIVEQRRLSPDGHTETVIPPLGEDYDAHLFNQAFQRVQIMNPFLEEAMKVFVKKFSVEDIVQYLNKSPIFPEDERDYLREGLVAYWNGNYMGASHSFIPFIESAFRKLIAGSGGITLRPSNKSKYSVYEYRTLDALLNDQTINQVFQFDISFYFQLILTHPLGWNLRNNLAHGIALNSYFRKDISDRLFHILLILSLVRIGQKSVKKRPDNFK